MIARVRRCPSTCACLCIRTLAHLHAFVRAYRLRYRSCTWWRASLVRPGARMLAHALALTFTSAPASASFSDFALAKSYPVIVTSILKHETLHRNLKP
eukprot:5642842-Pleurochrysis_carterae.AAC.2